MTAYPNDDPAFPLLLEPHEKALGFGVFLVSEGFSPDERRKPPKRVVLCPVGDSDAVVKTIATQSGGDVAFIYQQKCFGVAEGEEQRPAYWHPVSGSVFVDAGSALKKLDFTDPSPVLGVRRSKYVFNPA